QTIAHTTPLHCGISAPSMSALGQKRPINSLPAIAACPLCAKSGQTSRLSWYVRLAPKRTHASQTNGGPPGETRLSRRRHLLASALLAVLSDRVFPSSSY